MATVDLWQRITNDNLPENDDPEDQKIPLHGFWGMVEEWERGYETQANVLNTFNLAAGVQIQQGAEIKSHINAAPDKTRFLQVCKSWSYAGELNLTAKYRDWAQFVTRMAAEVTDQGGTPP